MKKLLLFLLIFISLSVNAQLFEGGVDFGLSAAQIDGDSYGGFNHMGVSALFYAQLNLGGQTSLTSGVSYVQKGAHSKVKQDYFSTNLHYTEIPVLFNYKPWNKISFSVGPTIGYLIRGRYVTSYIIQEEDELNLKKMDLSYYFSINYDLSNRTTLKFVNNYSLLSVTQPYSGCCFGTNFWFFYLNTPTAPCWWNYVVRLTLQYKLFYNQSQI